MDDNTSSEVPRWNATNIETEGVTLVDTVSSISNRVYRLHKDHPMLAMFRANWQALGLYTSTTEMYPSSNGVYYHVTGEAFDMAFSMLRPLMLGYARLGATRFIPEK